MARLIRRKIVYFYFSLTKCSSPRMYCTENNRRSEKVMVNKFKVFKDEDSPIILDIEEESARQSEKRKKEKNAWMTKVEEGIFRRGVTGVFEIEELVSYLKEDNAKDIFVVKIPEDLKYVEYLVLVTGKSRRHLIGLAEYIRQLFKKKMSSSDIIPIIEGKNSSDWIAMDLGNIALHIMSDIAREKYDLESLWSIGPKYDVKANQEDQILELLKKHSINLDDFRPLRAS